jgi:hypothetical protein
MGRPRKPRYEPGDSYPDPETGEIIKVLPNGEEEVWTPPPYDPFPEEPEPEPPDVGARRRDGSVSPHRPLTLDQLEEADEPTMRAPRADGWTLERQRHFIETLAATASISEAARFVGMSRQGAHKLYRRDPAFRAAWDEALKAAVGVLAATAFDRAVNGTEEQVWYKGRMVGFREKHHDRLLMYLLRVRDPLNYAPLDDLAGWQRHRALEGSRDGVDRALERLAPPDPAAPGGEAGNAADPAALPAPAAPAAPDTPAAQAAPAAPDPPPDPLLAALQRLEEGPSRAPPREPKKRSTL